MIPRLHRRIRDDLTRRLREEAEGRNTSRERTVIRDRLSIIVASGASGNGAHPYYRDLRPGGTTHPLTVEGLVEALL